ncbi:hypothetical protein GCM10010411_76630 [Actinomadura fulvescens]|uniref:Uncharacterized protein n=1 Tax=Actinomadura fulvescens TaxID=46160 RepID=A0ABN3QJF8_9ACTN
MTDQVTKHLWEYDHPYYCDPHNWFVPLDQDNGQNHIHPSWPAFLGFLDRNGCNDPDTFLVFRWDWDRDEDPDDGDEPRNDLNLSVMLQSRGDYGHHTVRMTDEDEPAARAWLTERASTTAAIWEPLLPTAEALKKAEEETQRLRAAVESFRAPLDWHNADHRARIREGMVDTLQTMTGRPAEDIADQLMRYSDSAIWAVECEQARTAELAGAVHASAAEVDRLEPPVATATIRDGWLLCPHCGDRDSIVQIDSATRKHRLSVASDDVVGRHMAHGDFVVDGYQCTTCDHKVDVPFEVQPD